MNVELIYDNDCPNIKAIREQLLKAFAKAKLPATWKEWERSDSNAPAYVKDYGSPTLLINDQDFCGEKPSGTSCRLYYDAATGNYDKTPSIDNIVTSLQNANQQSNPPIFSWKRMSALLPVAFTAVLPKFLCPICWVALAGLLSLFGVNLTAGGEHLHISSSPVMIIFLVIVLATLVYRAKLRWGYTPFVIGIIAATMIVTGKYAFNSAIVLYTGVVLLSIVTIWNSWPRKNNSLCTTCVPEASN